MKLLLNTLYIISETEKELELTLSIFKLRLLCILGFFPNVNECTNCKEKEELKYFSLRDNGFKCENCALQDTSVIKMSESTINAIKYTITSPVKKIFSFSLKNEALEEFKLIVKVYFEKKLEKKYEF